MPTNWFWIVAHCFCAARIINEKGTTRRGLCLFFKEKGGLREFFFQSGFLAGQVAQVEKLGAADFAVAFDHNFINAR